MEFEIQEYLKNLLLIFIQTLKDPNKRDYDGMLDIFINQLVEHITNYNDFGDFNNLKLFYPLYKKNCDKIDLKYKELIKDSLFAFKKEQRPNLNIIKFFKALELYHKKEEDKECLETSDIKNTKKILRNFFKNIVENIKNPKIQKILNQPGFFKEMLKKSNMERDISENIKDLDLECSKVVDDNFWDFIDEELTECYDCGKQRKCQIINLENYVVKKKINICENCINEVIAERLNLLENIRKK